MLRQRDLGLNQKGVIQFVETASSAAHPNHKACSV